jgi:uncharacterized LabA/DUF88 family protein
MDKSAIFIDAGYLNKIIKTEFDYAKLDYLKFSNNLSQGTERFRTYYYDCMPFQSNPPTEFERKLFSGMDRFIYSLRKLPRFDVKLGKLGKRTQVCRECDFRNIVFEQKKVDILMAVDIVRLSWQKSVNNIIIIAGDSDFIPAIKNAKEAGMMTQLYYSKYSVHDELLIMCDDTFQIDDKLIQSSLIKSSLPPKKKRSKKKKPKKRRYKK